MELSKLVPQLIGIVFMFIFLPLENRIFLFHNNPDSYYGEFKVKCKHQDYIIAKNCADDDVKLDKNTIRRLYSKNIGNKQAEFSEKDNLKIPQSSYALIIVDKFKFPLHQRVIEINNKEYRVKELNLITDAEANFSYFITLFLIFLVSILVYLITEFILKNRHEF